MRALEDIYETMASQNLVQLDCLRDTAEVVVPERCSTRDVQVTMWEDMQASRAFFLSAQYLFRQSALPHNR